jgi:hypothetical protein
MNEYEINPFRRVRGLKIYKNLAVSEASELQLAIWLLPI